MSGLLALRFAQEADTARAAAPEDAARAALARADEAAAGAPGRARWACAPGCAWCCFLRVEVTDAEARLLAPFVEDVARLEDAARRAAAGERVRCAFLDGALRCAAYAARPLACRAHASYSADDCARGSAASRDFWMADAGDAVRRGLGGAREELHATLLRVLREEA